MREQEEHHRYCSKVNFPEWSCVYFFLKLFLDNFSRAFHVLDKGVRGVLQCLRRDRMTRLQRAMRSFSHQFRNLLIGGREVIGHQGNHKEKAQKNGTEDINLRSQAKIS